MRKRLCHFRSSALAGAVCATAVALLAGPALAQTVVEDVTVMGKVPKTQRTLSYVVGFGDLDLRTEAGRKEVSQRVSTAATYVCRKLDEPATQDISSCRAQAIQDAMLKVRAVEHEVRAHGVHLVPGRPWTPPPE